MSFRLMFCCAKGFDGGSKSSWRVFSMKELLAATNNFNYDNKLGEGDLGSVYWGQLSDGSEIAVKRLKAWSEKADVEFSIEVEVLARVRHKNLVNVRGYCAEGQERLIVYDFMPNLSVFYHLHRQQSAECVLDWRRRMNIAIGSAEGILYLHHHVIPRIIHGDIKSSNILLDSEFHAKVADFQFTGFISDGETQVKSRVKDINGYISPEYAKLGRASESSDVYSFGILLLELVSGRRALQKINPGMNLLINDWAFPLAREGNFRLLADPKLNVDFDERELRRVVLVGLVAAQEQPENRPTMMEVLGMLKGEKEDKMLKFQEELFRNRQSADERDELSEASSLTEDKDLKPEQSKDADVQNGK